MKYGLLMGLLAACTKPNPNYHPDGAVDLDAPTADVSPTVDAQTACKHELLVQRGGLFNGGQLVVVDVDSFDETPVSNGIDVDIDGAWSPDGAQVAFVRNADTIWVASADGSNGRQLDVRQDHFLGSPTWSNDGARIVYQVIATSGSVSEAFSVASNGTGGTDLGLGSDVADTFAWSRDDKSLLYVSTQTGNYDIYLTSIPVGAGGNLTHRSGDDGKYGVAWMHEDADVVFASFDGRIYTMKRDGTNIQNIIGTGTTKSFDAPVYDPVNDRVFAIEGAARIWSMSSTGNGLMQVTSGDTDKDPSPSPDGARLAWSSSRDGTFHIYVANADGSSAVRVTNTGTPDSRPRWRPCL